MNSQSYLFFDKPAKNESECFLLAGGSFEIIDDGGVRTKNLRFVNSKIYPTPGLIYNFGKESLNSDINKLLTEKNADIFKNSITNSGVKATKPVCEIKIKSDGSDFPYEKYIRKLNLEHGLQRVSYSINGIMREQESFVSFDDSIYCSCFKSSAVDGWIFEITSEIAENIKIEKLKVRENTDITIEITGFIENDKKAQKEEKEIKNKYFAMVAKINTDGSALIDGNKIIIKNCTNLTLLAKAKSSFTSVKSAYNKCIKILDGKEYGKLLDEHRNGFSEMFDRVEFKLFEKDTEGINIRKQLKSVSRKNNAQFMVLYYNYARYLLITSSSKSCSAPSPLILNSDNPYYFDLLLSTQMKYWGAESGNLSECHESFFKLIKQIAENGKQIANRLGLKGWSCFNRSTMFGETTYLKNDNSLKEIRFIAGIAGTLCKHISEHFEYTQDLQFLSDNIDILEGAVKFYLGYLAFTNEKNIICPSQTVINGTAVSTLCSTFDIAVIRDTFKEYLKACKILSIKNESIKKIKEILPLLDGYKVSEENTILTAEEKDFQKKYSIYSLYGIYPSEEMLDNLKLCKCAINTLNRIKDKSSKETVYKAMCYTRLGNGDKALHLIKELLKYRKGTSKNKIGTGANLFSSESVNFDINLGIMAVINEMLIQQSERAIMLLPALPAVWKEGSITGLKCKKGISADIYWKNNKVTAFKINGKDEEKEVFVNGILKTFPLNKMITEI